MASPHVVALSAVGFNSKTRTVKNFNLQVANALVYDDTAQYPSNALQKPQSGPLFARMSFTTELNPSGSAAGAKTPPDDMLFEACGIQGTVNGTTDTTYTVSGASADVTAVALSSRIGDATGYKQLCSNAVGNLSLSAGARAPIMCNWTFDGTYTAPTEATLADALSNGGLAPVCIGTITLNSDTLVMKSFNIDLGNITNAPNLDMAGTNGVASPGIVNQSPVFTTVVEVPAFATANYWTDLTSNTVTPFSIAIGTGAGFVITITGKGYLTAAQQLQNVNGRLGAQLSYRMGWSSGEPIAIAFT